MRSSSLALILPILLAGCATGYAVKLDGTAVGTDRDTPRAIHPGIYPDAVAAHAVSEGAAGHLAPIGEATVRIALKFKDEHRARAAQTVETDSRTGKFHFEASGEQRAELTGATVRIEAPGWIPVEQFIPGDGRSRLSRTILAVLDPAGVGVPSLPQH